MKQFIVLILVISAINIVKSECEDDCLCPDLLSLTQQADNFLYTKLAGCVSNMTCPADGLSAIVSSFSESEISFDDSTEDFFSITW
ncbi:hypothetical protein CAEBREN_30834 [Caenorhabditis brenneri]|uniref:Uncharacterized protein n=1 Tax=Caenorhabditis brenneri TaxID=135651 RepID=G0MT89_CAEBE|nr:hypothetical protein CAEBREN_30834 [Caenorhabditis brenneri]